MKDKNVKIWSVILTAVILLAIFALIFVFNSKTPLYKDDYSYSYTFAVKENKFRISNIKELIYSQINHYKVMNGRIVPHTLAQAFLMTDKAIFNIFNTLAFSLLVFIISKLATAGKGNNPFYLIAAFASLFLLTPRFGESYLWLTSACNYLWGMLLILLYLIPVTKRAYSSPNSNLSPLAVLGTFILGTLCTMTGENTSAALIVMSLLFTIYSSVKSKALDVALLWGLVGNVCGFLTVLLAPGQSVRLSNNGGLGGLQAWLDRLAPITELFFSRLWLLVAISVVFVLIGLLFKRERVGLFRTIIFALGGLASVYSMIISPYFPERVWSGPTILFTLSALSAISYAVPNCKHIGTKIISFILLVCILISVIQTVPDAHGELVNIYEQDKARAEQIVSAAEKGDNSVVVDSIYGSGRYTCFDNFGDLNADSSTWPNTALAMYFEIDEVVKKEEKK